MPRSSRHKSHRQHRRNNSSRGDVRERSDSEEEEERRVGDALLVSSSGARESGSEKRKGGLFVQGPEECNVAFDVGKSADLLVVDRWGGEDGKEATVDELGEEKVAVAVEKGKGAGVGDWKKSSTRHDGSGGRKERSGSDRDESSKRRSERELSRSERGNQHTDVKERDREHLSDRDREYLAERRKDHDVKKDREREFEEREHRMEKVREHRQERDREHRPKRSREQLDDMDREHGLGREGTDVARERCNDPPSRKYGSRLGDCEHTARGSQENADKRGHEELHNADLDKDALRKVRRRDHHGDKEKRQEDDREITERKLSIDDRVRNGSSKVEIYREERYKEKYREDFDRDERPRYDKHRDSRSSRDYSSGRTDIKHNRDEYKQSENHNKKSRIEENGRGSSPYNEYSMKYRDKREKKRFSDVIDVHSDPKFENKEDPRMAESNIFDGYKFEVTDDRARSEIAKGKGSADNNRQAKSSNSSSQVVNNAYRRSLERPEATHVKLWSEEQQSLNPSGEPLSELTKCPNSASVEVLDAHKERLPEVFMVEDLAAASQLQTTPSDGYSSPAPLSERVPSSSIGRRYSNKVDAVRHSGVVAESGSNNSKDGRAYPTNENKEQDLCQDKQETTNANSQMELPNGDSVPGGPVSCSKADPFSSCSPSPLRPSSSVRHSPISFSDGDRFQAGDRKSNSRYKRTGEINMGRGHGHAMKGVLNWPSPVPNGFIPFQHGPPPGGFYPVVQPFPAPMFGIRPQMDLKQSGNPFHMNENSDRFSGHCRPFGWRNPVDDPFPPLQGWNGNNIFSDGSYMHCRSDWEQKNHLINHSSSEMSSEILKNQNGNTCLPYLSSDKETVPSMHASDNEVWSTKSSHQPSSEQPEREYKQGKVTGDNHAAKEGNEFSSKNVLGKKLVSSKLADDSSAAFCSTCLSKLDISPDLASPELYGQWTKKVELKRNEISDGQIMDKNDVGVMPTLGIFGRAKRPLFPALSDDVFQRAMSLYGKNNGAKTSTLSNFPSKEEMDTSEFSDADKIAPVKITASYKSNLLATENTCSSIEEDANKLGEPTPVQVDPLHDANNLGEHKKVHQDDPTSVIQDGRSNVIYSADNCVEGVAAVAHDGQSNITYGSASCAEGSPLGCEAIMQDCRVNINRIQYSPESTH